MTNSIFRLIYSSEAIDEFCTTDLLTLINQARANNFLLDITGLLLFYGRYFLQILEGEKEQVLALFQKIKKDNRHFNVNRLTFEASPERMFSQWRMGLANFPKQLPRLSPKDFISKNIQLSINDLDYIHLLTDSFAEGQNRIFIQ